eukprot:376629-Pyramimonas_sp.AAC.1
MLRAPHQARRLPLLRRAHGAEWSDRLRWRGARLRWRGGLRLRRPASRGAVLGDGRAGCLIRSLDVGRPPYYKQLAALSSLAVPDVRLAAVVPQDRLRLRRRESALRQ